MKNLSFLLIFTCLLVQTSFSQTTNTVKRQYVDTVNASTTVVVKENQASDIDILNNQFDLDNVSMGEVIMIKTDTQKPPKPKSERTSFSNMVEESEKPAKAAAIQPVENPVVASATPARPKSRPVANTPKRKRVVKKAAVEKKQPQRYFGVGSSRKVKTKKRKLKKRKGSRKRARKSCYSF